MNNYHTIPKFRAWDKQLKRWTNYEITDDLQRFYGKDKDCWYCDIYNHRFILLQATGLTDINDNEIFEGDILLSTASENQEDWKKWQVHYADGRFLIDYKQIPKDKRKRKNLKLEDLCEDNIWFYGLEVIGNIYENPELMEVE